MNPKNCLHILNGDGTYYGFKDSGIKDDFTVWREALALGPVVTNINSDQFRKMRSEFLSVLSEEDIDYNHVIAVDNFSKSKNGQFDKFVLWFEFDLFCQINMIAVLWLIRQNKISTKISLISLDSFPGHPHFKGYGELNGEEQRQLLTHQIILHEDDIQTAAKVWELYSGTDQLALQDYIETADLTRLPHLRTAIKNHFKRFPNTENGLNEIEIDILKRIQSGLESERKLVGSILQNDRYFSLGDLFYFDSLKRLSDCFESTDAGLRLTETGEKLLANQLNFSDIADAFPIAGTHSNQFSYDRQSQRLLAN
ncbi:MAG: hypothetical protein KDD94_14015 [Calditrichaeota bacterium]|nr:hypothetical protein [Calditrichota bacterium]